MARRISIANSGDYSSPSGTNDFFSLENDGDSASVRFLYESSNGEDLDYYLCHQIDIDGKKRYVACNSIDEEGNFEPDNCELCRAGEKRIEKLFLQLYNADTKKVETWDRGKTFVSKIQSYINRYGALINYPIDIERKGAKGDTNTTYELFILDKEEKTLADFPEKQDLIGTLILEVSNDDMLEMLDGTYRVPGATNDVAPANNSRRRERSSSEQNTSKDSDSAPQGRRRGARRGTGDGF